MRITIDRFELTGHDNLEKQGVGLSIVGADTNTNTRYLRIEEFKGDCVIKISDLRKVVNLLETK